MRTEPVWVLWKSMETYYSNVWGLVSGAISVDLPGAYTVRLGTLIDIRIVPSSPGTRRAPRRNVEK
jgi:hypothetical protein